MTFPTKMLNQKTNPPYDAALYSRGVYTLCLPGVKAVYVGRSDQLVWLRLCDHYNRPRYEIDKLLKECSEFDIAAFTCKPTAHIEYIGVLRAENWCAKNGWRLANRGFGRYTTLDRAARNALIEENYGRYIPTGDESCVSIQGVRI